MLESGGEVGNASPVRSGMNALLEFGVQGEVLTNGWSSMSCEPMPAISRVTLASVPLLFEDLVFFEGHIFREARLLGGGRSASLT